MLLLFTRYLSSAPSSLKNYLSITHAKCNSARSFSGSGQRNQSKCSIALPTNAENIRVFEKKTLIGGFRCVNTRLAFDNKYLSLIKKMKKYCLI